MNAPSRRSIIVGIMGLVIVALVWAVLSQLDPDGYAFLAVSDLGEALVIAACAAIVFVTAFQMGPGRFRNRWLAVGAGVASYAIGDFVWAYLELVQRVEVPYPGIPDYFYVGEYLFLAVAITAAGLAYSRIVDVRRPALLASLATASASLAMWVAFIEPIAFDLESSAAERMLSVFYPMADIVLLGGPALFTILVIANLGTGVLGHPWRFVALGAAILAASDTAFSVLSTMDAYQPGTVVDFGWMLAHIAIAFGALIALDIAAPAPVVSPAEVQSA